MRRGSIALGHLPYGTAEIDVDDAYLVLLDQPAPNFGERRGIIVPDLHRQGTRLVGDSPQAVGMFGPLLVEPDKTPRVDHLGGD